MNILDYGLTGGDYFHARNLISQQTTWGDLIYKREGILSGDIYIRYNTHVILIADINLLYNTKTNVMETLLIKLSNSYSEFHKTILISLKRKYGEL